jgi:hypothetical protein
MANGLYGKGVTVANTWTLVYTVPSSGLSVATTDLDVCNVTTNTSSLSIAIGTGSSPADGDYIDTPSLSANGGKYEWAGKLLSPGEKVWIKTTQTGVNYRMTGLSKA